jgi:hypothetical protein
VFSGAPAWVTTLMRANFRTPQGALVVGDMTAPLPDYGQPLMATAVYAQATAQPRL